MLAGYVVEAAHDPALQQSIPAFRSIYVHVTARVFAFEMRNTMVTAFELAADADVRTPFIRQ